MKIPTLPLATLLVVFLTTASIPASAAPTAAQPHPLSPGACGTPEARQFDFWIGEWDVLNRYLLPAGWVVAGRATARIYPILEGCALVEHWRGTLGEQSIHGFSVRAFDPETGQWHLALNWPSPEKPSFSTLAGQFRHGRGEFFYSFQSPEGVETRARYTFSDATEDSLRWDQAFSTDGGQTWKTTWIMEFSRRPAGTLPLFNGPSQSTRRCTFTEARQFDALIGRWQGERSTGSSREASRAALSVHRILDGCALMEFFEADDGFEEFRIRSFDPALGRWVVYRIDNRAPVFRRLEGRVDGDTALFETSAEPADDSPGEARPDDLPRIRWTVLGENEIVWERSTPGGSAGSTAGDGTIRVELRRID